METTVIYFVNRVNLLLGCPKGKLGITEYTNIPKSSLIERNGKFYFLEVIKSFGVEHVEHPVDNLFSEDPYCTYHTTFESASQFALDFIKNEKKELKAKLETLNDVKSRLKDCMPKKIKLPV